MPHFVIDGYNVICQSEALSRGSLRDRRERLLRWVEERRPQGSPSNRATVVFDGQADVSSPRWPGPTRVIFSCGQDADRVIKDLVDEAGNPRETVVVTDDRDIQRWVRGVGARVMAVKSFLSAGAEPSPRPRGAALHPADAETINEELKRLWKLK